MTIIMKIKYCICNSDINKQSNITLLYSKRRPKKDEIRGRKEDQLVDLIYAWSTSIDDQPLFALVMDFDLW